MSKQFARAVALVAAVVCGFAAPAGAADSIKIVSASPASGALPVSPATGTVTISYTLESAKFAKIQAGHLTAVPKLAGWPGFQGGATWVSKGTGQVTVSYSFTCQPESPAFPIDTLLAQLFPSKTMNGPTAMPSANSQFPTPGGWVPCKPLPDIRVPKRSGIVLGQKGVTWGSSVSLTPADSGVCKDGRCAFEATYGIVNAGGSVNIWPFASRLSLDSPVNRVAEASNLTLKSGTATSVRTKVTLPAGTHTLFLVLDPTNKVMEGNENNNQYQITYTLGAPLKPLKAAAPVAHR